MLRCCGSFSGPSGFSVPRIYQLATSSWPSGFACTQRMMSSLRMRIVSGSVRLVSWYTVSMSCCDPHRLAGVQAAVDPHHRLALRRQLVRLGLGHALGMRHPGGNLFELVEILDVIGGRNDGHPLIAGPSSVLPRLTSFMRSDSPAIFFQYASSWV